MSEPPWLEVTVTDAYEVDDSSVQAPILAVGDIQEHNLHWELDEDWVKFYAPAGRAFGIEVEQMSTNSDLQLHLYYEQPDGSLADVGWARQPLLDCNLENARFYALRSLQRFRIKRWDY